jgi:hypothetical protein
MLFPKDESYLDLESIWRHRLTRAEERLASAVVNSKRLLAELEEGMMVPPDGSLAIRNAHFEEAHARQEYMRTLRIFTDLTLYGATPQGEDW